MWVDRGKWLTVESADEPPQLLGGFDVVIADTEALDPLRRTWLFARRLMPAAFDPIEPHAVRRLAAGPEDQLDFALGSAAVRQRLVALSRAAVLPPPEIHGLRHGEA